MRGQQTLNKAAVLTPRRPRHRSASIPAKPESKLTAHEKFLIGWGWERVQGGFRKEGATLKTTDAFAQQMKANGAKPKKEEQLFLDQDWLGKTKTPHPHYRNKDMAPPAMDELAEEVTYLCFCMQQ
jgi:hypothetical protein